MRTKLSSFGTYHKHAFFQERILFDPQTEYSAAFQIFEIIYLGGVQNVLVSFSFFAIKFNWRNKIRFSYFENILKLSF